MDEHNSLPSQRDVRVLIVDDHPRTASLLARAIERSGTPIEVLTAGSGEEALEIIDQAPVDVLITDFMMPGMNGLELIEKLQDGREPAHTVLITAYDTPGLATTAARLKVDDYLAKPVHPDRIRELIDKALQALTATESGQNKAGNGNTPFKILVADDYPDNIHLLTRYLEREGYSFITAHDGNETLRRVRDDQPDLVLLDVNMPRKDGFEVLAEMRADEEIAHIPVIVITAARIQARDVRFGLTLGADDYITKPFDWRDLAARMRSKLRVKRAEDALRQRNKELSILPDIGQELAARLDVGELAGVLLERTVKTLDATNAHLVVFTLDDGVYHKLWAEQSFGELDQDEALRRIVSEGVVTHVVAQQKSLVVADTEEEPRWSIWPTQKARSALIVPLLSQRGVIGVLTLVHRQAGHFQPDQAALLQAIAAQAAIAIENVQYYALEHERVQLLVALNQLTHALNHFTRSDEVLEQTPQLTRDALGYPAVSLWLVEDGEPLLRSLAGSANAPRPSVMELAPRQVAESGQPAQLSGSIEEREGERARLGTPPTQSAVAVPLIWGGEVRGVIAVHSKRAHTFHEGDRVVLETLASQVVTALERIRLFESVEREQWRLSAVLQAAADPILVFDDESRLRLLNPAGKRLFTDIETRLGQPLPAGKGYDALMRFLDQGRNEAQESQVEINWPDERTFNAVATPIANGGQALILHDITHFKEMERVKNDFIATASHDLKNPLTAIVGYNELLGKAGPLTPMQSDFVERIGRASQQMAELVTDLLELARLDMGVDLNREPVDLGAMLSRVIDEFRTQAGAKNQELALDLEQSTFHVIGDELRLGQVVRNLIGNAVKYTPEGGRIICQARLDDRRVQIRVQDNGIGIPPADLPFIFDKFYRVQNEATQDIEGSGLGLAVVKAVIEQHDGKVWVESNQTQGTCFHVSLPLSQKSDRAAESLVEEVLENA